MSADNGMLEAVSFNAVRQSGTARPDSNERTFWAGLVCALLLHAMFLVGFVKSPPRTLGGPDGREDALNVEIVDAADLQESGPAAAPVAPFPPTASAPPPPPAPSPSAEPAPEPSPDPRPREPAAKQQTMPSPEDLALPDLFKLPEPPASPSAKANPEKKPAKRTAALDLSLPADMRASSEDSASRSATATRPPGVTRSGQNDEFGRAVIRALRVTMPPPNGILGRVMVRILLSENGNVIEVRVLRSADNPELDQSVKFAALQASYPIPPANSTVADRTFLVTYVYH